MDTYSRGSYECGPLETAAKIIAFRLVDEHDVNELQSAVAALADLVVEIAAAVDEQNNNED